MRVEDLQGLQKNLKASRNFVQEQVEIFKFIIEFLLIFIKLMKQETGFH